MIEKLTSELNRINQGCGEFICETGFYAKDGMEIDDYCGDLDFIDINKRNLCPTCQKEKETLKKVSIMWAEKMTKRICSWTIKGDYPENHETVDNIVKLREECEQIKSLMEKA